MSTPPFALRPWMALLVLSPSLALAAEKTPTTLGTTTVTATRIEQKLVEVPNTVSVIDEHQIDQQNVKHIKDLVRYEPGVSVSGTGSRFGLSGFTIRGIGGNRVLTQVDGVAMPQGNFFSPFQDVRRDYVDPDTIKQVEIIRGPASTLYGSDAIGGAVSFLTKDAADYLGEGDDASARLKTGYDGSDDSWQRSATFAARQGSVDGLLHLGRRDGQATNTFGGRSGAGRTREEANPLDYRTDNMLAKLGWDYAEGDRLQLTYEHYEDYADANLLSEINPVATLSTPAIRGSQSLDSIDRERFSLEHDFQLDSQLVDRLRWQLSYQDSENRQDTVQQRRTTGGVNRLRTRQSQYEEQLWNLNTQLDKAFTLGQTQHQLIWGFDAKRIESSNLREGREIRLDTGAAVASPENFPLSDFPDPTSDTIGLFVQDSIEIGRWTLLPGLRYDHFRQDPEATDLYLRKTGVNPTPDEITDDHWSPKLGATYQLTAHESLYGQYAAGFRAPTPPDMYSDVLNAQSNYRYIGNPNLKPETSNSFETGLRGEYAGGSFSLALFYNRYKDFIEDKQIGTEPGSYSFMGLDRNVLQRQNLSKVTIRGAEAKGELLLDQFGLPAGTRALGSIAYARGKDEESGEPLNSVDPLKAVLGLGYTAPGSKFGGDLAWTLVAAKERVDHSGDALIGINSQFETPGYGTLDLNTWWQVTEQFTVNAGLFNLTDKQHWNWGDVQGWDEESPSLGCYTQPGRYGAVNLIWEI